VNANVGWAAVPAADPAECSRSLVELAGAAVAAGGGGWSLRVGAMWCVVRPAGRALRSQGWKLHVSATPLSAPDVLARALPVLLGQGCAFKFAPPWPGSAG